MVRSTLFRGVRSPRSRSLHRKLTAAIESLESRQLLSAGSLDPTFGSGGVAAAPAFGPINGVPAIAAENNGNYLVATDKEMPFPYPDQIVVSQYNSSGALDTSFGQHGTFTSDIAAGFYNPGSTSIAIAPDGNIFVVSTDENNSADVFDLTAAGTLDSSFGAHGVQSVSFTAGTSPLLTQIAVDPGGNVVLAGECDEGFAIATLSPNGNPAGQFVIPQSGVGDVEMALNSTGEIFLVGVDDGNYVSVGTDESGNAGVVNTFQLWLGADTFFNPFFHIAINTTDNANNLIVATTDDSYLDVSSFAESGPNSYNFPEPDTDSTAIQFGLHYLRAQSVAIEGDSIAVGLDVSEGTDSLQNGICFGVAIITDSDGLAGASYSTGYALPSNLTTSAYLNTSTLGVGFDAGGDVSLVGSLSPANGGYSDLAFSLFLPNGSPDNTLNGDGIEIEPLAATEVPNHSSDNFGGSFPLMGLEPDGNVVEAFTTSTYDSTNGMYATFIAELDSNGAPDASFGNDGIVQIDQNNPDFKLTAMAIDPTSGAIYLAGDSTTSGEMEIVSYEGGDGQPNNSFGPGGYTNFYDVANPGSTLSAYATAATVAASGDVVVTGIATGVYSSYSAVAEIVPGVGTAESEAVPGSFIPTSITTDSSGNIILGGADYDPVNNSQLDMAAMRLQPGGAMDTTFGSGGVETVDLGANSLANSVAVDAAGDVVLAGEVLTNPYSGNSEFAVAELNGGDGSPDTSFNGSGSDVISLGTTSAATGVGVDPSGNILVAGNSTDAGVGSVQLAEFTGGSLNPSFGDSGILTGNFDSSTFNTTSGLAIDGSDQVVVGGISDFNGSGISAVAARYFTSTLSTSVSVSPVVSTYGDNIDLSAAVSADATVNSGDVTFTITDASDNLLYTSPAEPVTGGAATAVATGIAAGDYTITASYSGTNLYAPNSGSNSLTVNQATPTVTATAATFNYNTSAYPDSDVTPTVTGLDDTVTLSDGSFTFSYFDSSENPLSGAPTDAGNYFVQANWSGDANFTAGSSALVAFTINQVAPAVAASAAGITFNGTAYPNSDVSATVTGVDNAIISDGTLSYSYFDASENPLSGPPTNAGSYYVSATFSGDTNYTSATSALTAFTIAQATPSVTASAAGITYNAAAYPNSDVTVTVTGVGDSTISDGSVVSYTYYDSVGNQLSGAPTNAGSYSVIAAWSGDANYIGGSSAKAPFTIGQATPTVTASAANITYTGMAYPNSDVTVSVTGVGNAPISDGSVSYTYYNQDMNQLSGPPTAAGTYSVIATWSGDANYASAQSNDVPFVINPVINNGQAIVTASAATITYNGSPYPSSDITVTVTGTDDTPISDGSFTYAYFDASNNLLSGAPTNAGSYSVIVTWSGDVNYASASSAQTPFTINQATATVSLSNLTQTYNGSPLSATAATNPNGLSVSITYNGSPTAPTTAGSYAVLATVNNPNYQGSASGTLLINKAAATVSLSSLTDTYNGSPQSAVVTTNPSGLSVNVTYNGSPTAPTNAGSYAVVATVNNPNYQGSASGTFVIHQATATVTLSNLNQTYTGLPLSASAATNPNGLSVSITYNGSPTAPTNAGSYAVLASISNPNYQGTASGALQIAKANLIVTTNNASRAYGAANPTFSGTVTGLYSGDGITVTYSTTATPASAVGTYPITATLNDPNNRLSNYNTTITGGTLTVIKANLTIAANPQTKTYGSANPTLTGTITGLANGDNITATYSTTATTSSGVGTYPITVTVNDPTHKLSNYNLTVTNSTLTVTKAALTITANNQTKVYGSANPALTISYSGFVNGQNSSVLTSQPTISTTATTSSNVGSYPITVSGAAAANYSISYVSGTLQVTPATLYVLVDPTLKFIGQSDPNFQVVYVGFVLGQNASVLGGTLVYTTNASTDSPIGIYLVNASGLTSTNYDIVYVPGILLEL
jgi:uncharacterized delta-60 repeat protein